MMGHVEHKTIWKRSATHTAGLRLAAALMPLLLAGCIGIGEGSVQDLNATLPSPTAAPVTLSDAPKRSSANQEMIASFGGIYQWQPAQDDINAILVKLASASPNPTQPYKVTLLNSSVVNAFAMPSGDLFVTRGLLALVNDNAEIAAVMAHEIGHVTSRHAAKRDEFAKRSALISKVTSVIENQAKGALLQADSRAALASYSRQQELDADQIGIKVAARAGFDPYAAARFLSSLEQSSRLRAALVDQKSSTTQPDFLATHPSTPQRITLATQTARQISAPGIGIDGNAQFLAAINGMTFGDDPSEGVIRANRFSHPKLGFGFDAPTGFVLENSSKAVLGIADGGNEALRLDSVHLSSNTALATYLASGWIDGLQTNTIVGGSSHGLPIATATAKGGQWSFRVAVIRFGTDAYRMIFASKNLSLATDNRFRAAIASFHRLTSAEAAGVRPLRIATITAKPGDTIASLAARMTSPDRPLDHFLLINGLQPTSTIVPGQIYKLVVE